MGYRNLSKLSKEIQERIKRLEFGELNANELNELVEDSRELNERLSILRYKHHEAKVRSERNKKNLEGEIPVLFKMEEEEIKTDKIESPVLPNQTSLIDAIEEVVSTNGNSEETKEKEKPKEEVPTEKKEIKKAENIEDSSIVEKLEKAPITSLKKEINLNLKFRFINELFDGNSGEYNSFIESLDQLDSIADANKIIDSEGSKKYTWDEEQEEVILFHELVERRFTK